MACLAVNVDVTENEFPPTRNSNAKRVTLRFYILKYMFRVYFKSFGALVAMHGSAIGPLSTLPTALLRGARVLARRAAQGDALEFPSFAAGSSMI